MRCSEGSTSLRHCCIVRVTSITENKWLVGMAVPSGSPLL